MLLILVGIGIGIWFKFHSQKPSGKLVFASGQQGGVYVDLAKEFKRVIEKNFDDLEIELKPSAGSVENVSFIDNNTANLALVQNAVSYTHLTLPTTPYV